jgi:hypothetical protein
MAYRFTCFKGINAQLWKTRGFIARSFDPSENQKIRGAQFRMQLSNVRLEFRPSNDVTLGIGVYSHAGIEADD